MNQQEHNLYFDDSIIQKAKKGNNSGYLDEEYQTTKQFPDIHEYHFRIEDESQILEMSKIIKQSEPFKIGSQFYKQSSDAFKNKMAELMKSIDDRCIKFDNHHKDETHGFYSLDKDYQDQRVFQSILQSGQTEDTISKIQNMSVKDKETDKTNKQMKNQSLKKQKSKKVNNNKNQIKSFNNKFSRLTINQDDL